MTSHHRRCRGIYSSSPATPTKLLLFLSPHRRHHHYHYHYHQYQYRYRISLPVHNNNEIHSSFMDQECAMAPRNTFRSYLESKLPTLFSMSIYRASPKHHQIHQALTGCSPWLRASQAQGLEPESPRQNISDQQVAVRISLGPRQLSQPHKRKMKEVPATGGFIGFIHLLFQLFSFCHVCLVGIGPPQRAVNTLCKPLQEPLAL